MLSYFYTNDGIGTVCFQTILKLPYNVTTYFFIPNKQSYVHIIFTENENINILMHVYNVMYTPI